MKQKKITLNADKRKVIADQFQSFYENKVKDKLELAKEIYDKLRVQAKERIEKVVRYHQPQEDIDTIRAMSNKYDRAGGELYEDHCFYIEKQSSGLMMKAGNITLKMKSRCDLIWVETSQKHITERK